MPFMCIYAYCIFLSYCALLWTATVQNEGKINLRYAFIHSKNIYAQNADFK